MKILAFAGSNSSRSINRALLEHAAGLLKQHEVTVIDLRDFDTPLYSMDLEEQSGIPENTQRLRKLFDEHDAFMIASPENNGMMPAFFKNAMDWISRMEGKIFQGKPVMLMSTSPGPRGGQTNLEHMKAVIPHWGASAVFADFHLGRFYDTYDRENKTFTNPEDAMRLKDAIRDFEDNLSNQSDA